MDDATRERIGEILKRLREKAKVSPPQPEPRYDDIYWQGVEWLDEQ